MPSAQPDLDKELRRGLSLGSPASPSSPEPPAEPRPSFRKIGAGACGAIFAQEGKSHVVKLAKCSDGEELWNDYIKHHKIARQFQKYMIEEVRIPDVYFFVPTYSDGQSFWDVHGELREAAASVVNLPTAALYAERIMPLPSTTRELLIDKYCRPEVKEEARGDVANKDCLVRVYLGSTKGTYPSSIRTGKVRPTFSLRNFKLHLNHMVDLDLDIEAFARGMGKALAVLHWGAKTDARDVEFVLGSSTKVRLPKEPDWSKGPHYTGPPSFVDEDFFRPVTELFVLDFNQAQEITMDYAGVAMAVEAWRINDPYYPRPHGQTESEKFVWQAFMMSYLSASEMVMEGQGMDRTMPYQFRTLPYQFLEGIMEVEKKKMKAAQERIKADADPQL